jgi:threonine/homoserine/homoserine lactone efflux protein
MAGITNFEAFLLVLIVIVITPGADTLYTLTRSLSQGKWAGIYSAFGIVTGIMIHTVGVAFGVSLLIAKSAALLAVIKYAGAAYLIVLGIKTLLSKKALAGDPTLQPVPHGRIYLSGFVTNLLNPKAVLFFLALLPQFVRPESANSPYPYLILGMIAVVTSIIWLVFVAILASGLANFIRGNSTVDQYIKKVSGVVFVLLGLKLLFDKK